MVCFYFFIPKVLSFHCVHARKFAVLLSLFFLVMALSTDKHLEKKQSWPHSLPKREINRASKKGSRKERARPRRGNRMKLKKSQRTACSILKNVLVNQKKSMSCTTRSIKSIKIIKSPSHVPSQHSQSTTYLNKVIQLFN